MIDSNHKIKNLQSKQDCFNLLLMHTIKGIKNKIRILKDSQIEAGVMGKK